MSPTPQVAEKEATKELEQLEVDDLDIEEPGGAPEVTRAPASKEKGKGTEEEGEVRVPVLLESAEKCLCPVRLKYNIVEGFESGQIVRSLRRSKTVHGDEEESEVGGSADL